jgi:hypothetical protein
MYLSILLFACQPDSMNSEPVEQTENQLVAGSVSEQAPTDINDLQVASSFNFSSQFELDVVVQTASESRLPARVKIYRYTDTFEAEKAPLLVDGVIQTKDATYSLVVPNRTTGLRITIEPIGGDGLVEDALYEIDPSLALPLFLSF